MPTEVGFCSLEEFYSSTDALSTILAAVGVPLNLHFVVPFQTAGRVSEDWVEPSEYATCKRIRTDAVKPMFLLL